MGILIQPDAQLENADWLRTPEQMVGLSEVQVEGYTRADGTVVKPHVRRSVDFPTPDLDRLADQYEFEFTPDDYTYSKAFKASGKPRYEGAVMAELDNGFRKRETWIDPEIGEVKWVEGRIGKFEDVVPREGSGYSTEFPLQADPALMYRGVSNAEMASIMSTGKVRSNGSYNMGDGQVGMTLYAADPTMALSYASSFAPPQAKPALGSPSYVIAVRRPGDEADDPRLPGEIPYPREISAEEIVSVVEIRPGAVRPPTQTYVQQPMGDWASGGGASAMTTDFYRVRDWRKLS